MTYYDSAEQTIITKERAIQECKNHGALAFEMFEDLGEHAEYDAQEILDWLGY